MVFLLLEREMENKEKCTTIKRTKNSSFIYIYIYSTDIYDSLCISAIFCYRLFLPVQTSPPL